MNRWTTPARSVTIVVDPAVPPNEIHVGGVLVLPGTASLEEIGFATTSAIVRVPTSVHATGIESARTDVRFARFDLPNRCYVSPGL